MITENTVQNNTAPKKILKQLAITEEMDATLEALRIEYKNTHNLELTIQDIIRKMILDHPDYQTAQTPKN